MLIWWDFCIMLLTPLLLVAKKPQKPGRHDHDQSHNYSRVTPEPQDNNAAVNQPVVTFAATEWTNLVKTTTYQK